LSHDPTLGSAFHLLGCVVGEAVHGDVKYPSIDGKDGVAGSIPAALRTETPLGLILFDGVDHGLDRREDPSGRYPVTCQARPTLQPRASHVRLDKS
jgi:hypothetical protein